METNLDSPGSGSQSTFFDDETVDPDSDTETAPLPSRSVANQDQDGDDELDVPVSSGGGTVTYYIGSNVGDEEAETQDMAYVLYAVASRSRDLMNAFMSVSCTNGSETQLMGFSFDDADIEDIDVVDGQEESVQERMIVDVTGNTDTGVLLTTFSNVVLPPGPTNSEHIARITNWVMESSPSSGGGGEDGGGEEGVGVLENSRENIAIDYIAKLINLCAEKLEQGPLLLSSVGSIPPFEEGSETVFQLIARLLDSNYITEALMQIINLIWTTSTTGSFPNCNEDDADAENKASGLACKSREVMLMVLNCASPRRTRLNGVSIEKLLSHNIFTDGDYYLHVTLTASIKKPSKEFIVFQSVETWMNNALRVAFECRTALVDLDIRVILEVIMEVNRGRSLFLSPEEESKYATKAQRVARETLFNRCHTFLRSQGFAFDVPQQRPLREMAYYSQFNDPRSVPTGPPPRSQNQPYVDAWLRNEIADAYMALARDDAITYLTRENSPPPPPRQPHYRSNGDQGVPLSGSSQGSSSGGLGLFETAIDFGGIEFGRTSQDSLQSRMNQGYVSSQSLSQGSLPRPPLSQTSGNSSMNRFLNFDNQYILENQFFPSSSESSSGPAGPKRPRLGYSSSQ